MSLLPPFEKTGPCAGHAMVRSRALGIIALLIALTAIAQAQTQEAPNACGSIANAYGPFDYRRDKEQLKIVESSHFTPKVEALLGGVSGTIGAELDYALRASPNHHRILVTLVRLGERTKSEQPAGLQWPIECYFDRAIRFTPDDTIVRMLYAQFLGKKRRVEEGKVQLETAIFQAKDNAFSHYNIGLVFMELGLPERALAQAHRAIALGFARPELKQKLEQMGKWQEPPP